MEQGGSTHTWGHLASSPFPRERWPLALNTLTGDAELFHQLLCQRWTEREAAERDHGGWPGQKPRTHRNPRVLVQDDLQQMRGENGWRFKPLFWF